MQPSPFDLDTSAKTARLVAAAGVPFAFVLSRCKPRSPDVALSRAFLEQDFGGVNDIGPPGKFAPNTFDFV